MQGLPRSRGGPGWGAAGCVLLLILALGLSFGGWLQRVDHLVFDLGQRLQPEVTPQGLVIVAIDQSSLDRISALPWPRATDARLVDAVCRAGASAVGLDLAFTESGVDPAGNAALAQSLRNCGKVALPVVLETTRSGGQIVEGLPIPVLASAATGLGRIGVQLDGDGVARRVNLWEGVGEPIWPLLAQTLLTIARQPVRALAAARAGCRSVTALCSGRARSAPPAFCRPREHGAAPIRLCGARRRHSQGRPARQSGARQCHSRWTG